MHSNYLNLNSERWVYWDPSCFCECRSVAACLCALTTARATSTCPEANRAPATKWAGIRRARVFLGHSARVVPDLRDAISFDLRKESLRRRRCLISSQPRTSTLRGAVCVASSCERPSPTMPTAEYFARGSCEVQMMGLMEGPRAARVSWQRNLFEHRMYQQTRLHCACTFHTWNRK
jgi:hypothetical protein